jgi:hypothetical protein
MNKKYNLHLKVIEKKRHLNFFPIIKTTRDAYGKILSEKRNPL